MPTALLQRLDALTLQIINSVVPFPIERERSEEWRELFLRNDARFPIIWDLYS